MRERGFGDRDIARVEPWFMALGVQEPPPADASFRQFYRRILDFDPLPILQRLSIPSLWLLGDRDAEMPAAETAAILRGLVAPGKTMNVQMFTGADHSLLVTPTDRTFRWPQVVPNYIDAFADWIVSTAKVN